jgi:hypothetical protein
MYPPPAFCCGANFHDEEKTHVVAAGDLFDRNLNYKQVVC